MKNLIPLKEVAEIIMGQSPPSDTYNDVENGLPFFQGKAEFGQKYPVVRKWCSKPNKIAEPNDILLSVRAPVGSTNIANVKSCIGRGLAAIRCKNKKADPFFLWFYLRSIEKRIASKGVGSTFTAIGRDVISKLPVPNFKYPTQRKIASILEKAESAREKRREANRLTDEFLKSAFLTMFGDPVRNLKGWGVYRIKDIAAKEKHSIKAGPFGSSLKKEYYVEKGYKIYGQEQVIRDDLKYGDYYISEEKYKSLESNKIKEGDILISLVGTFGKISIVPKEFEPGIINPRLMKLAPNKKLIVPIFFKFLLLSDGIRAKIENFSHGGTMGIVNVGIVKEIKIPVPPLELQQKFADLVRKVEKLKEKQRESEKELDNLFNSLMQRAFRGEII